MRRTTLLNYIAEYDSLNDIKRYISNPQMVQIFTENNIKSLRPIQIEAINGGLFFRKNFLICTPSGSGKTLIAELAIANSLFNFSGKCIYLVPYKALAGEKYRYFKNNYRKYGFSTIIAVGDSEIEMDELLEADIIVTTFEKLDSLFRTNKSSRNNWLHQISTVIIDEIHVMSDPYRGFRLESLIIRLISDLYDAQMVCLSATIANPEEFCAWLNDLSMRKNMTPFKLIKSDVRPVKLNYKIEIALNKNAFIRKTIKKSLAEKGQVLLFVNSRAATKKNAKEFMKTIKKYVTQADLLQIESAIETLKKIPGSDPQLRDVLKSGVAYHNAGLLPQERHIVEDLYLKRHIKLICCTTTLAAGVNTPARVVILKDFKHTRYNPTIVEDELERTKILKRYFEQPGTERGYFIPYNPNQVFQLLGRAGRPGLDLTGEGIILTNNKEEYEWVLDYYFQGKGEDGNLVPKYKPIISSFNKIGALREEVLLLSYLYNGITIGQLKNFFRNSFFAFNYNGNIGLEYFLLLKNINTKVLLEIHSDSIKEKSPQVIQQHGRKNLGVRRNNNRKDTPRLKTKNYAPKLTNLKILQLHADHVEIAFKYDKYYSVTFDTNKGVMCSCGFVVNAERLSETDDVQNDYNFCKHIIALLQFLVYKINPINQKILTYLDDIIPYALKNERIIDFLIREGFLIEREGKFYPTSLGALTIQLYIRPIEMINLRRILSTPNSLKSPTELLRETYDIVAAEKRYQDEIYFKALLMWINEIDIERIVNLSEKISAGEFFNFRDEVIRKLSYIEGVAAFYGKDEIAELAETLQIRITHGIKEELFDLVLRIKGVGRTRGRTLYNAGFHSVMDLIKSSPQEIHQKSGLSQKTCHKIWQSLQEIKKKLL